MFFEPVDVMRVNTIGQTIAQKKLIPTLSGKSQHLVSDNCMFTFSMFCPVPLISARLRPPPCVMFVTSS